MTTPGVEKAQIQLLGVSKWYDRRKRRRLRAAWPGKPTAQPRSEDIVALRDIDLEIAPGDAIGIIGNNGAGKTTLLRLIAGVTAPSRGEVHVRGAVASMIELGLGFHPHLTGVENLAYSAQVLGMGPEIVRRRWNDIVAFSGIGDALHQPVRQYSTGMLARLGFSLAAHSDAPVILVDEVLAVGDYAFQRQSLDRLRALTAEGRTLVIVTHNLPSVVDVCNRVVQLVDGEMVAVGRPDTVVAEYVAEQDDLRHSEERVGLRIGEVCVEPASIDVGDRVTVSAEISVDRPADDAALVLRIGIGTALYGGLDTGNESMERVVDQPLAVPLDRAGVHRVTIEIADYPLFAAEYGIGFAVVLPSGEEVLRRLTRLTVHGDQGRRHLRLPITETIEALAPADSGHTPPRNRIARRNPDPQHDG